MEICSGICMMVISKSDINVLTTTSYITFNKNHNKSLDVHMLISILYNKF